MDKQQYDTEVQRLATIALEGNEDTSGPTSGKVRGYDWERARDDALDLATNHDWFSNHFQTLDVLRHTGNVNAYFTEYSFAPDETVLGTLREFAQHALCVDICDIINAKQSAWSDPNV